ncbi:MAG: hypothetical protein IPO08_20830 [Xanthomonadales bacterium]|nr:hypothetical protein [Xanthomonadales bacterium]
MARPRLEFDWNLVESLAMLETTEAFIAERLIVQDGDEVNHLTIQAKIKLMQNRIKERFDCSFVQFRQQKLEHRRVQLRQWQWKAAEKGQVAMLIWLGKQYLDQNEKQATTVQVGEDSRLVINMGNPVFDAIPRHEKPTE